MLGSTSKRGRNVILLGIALGVCLALFGCAGPAPPPTPAQAPTPTQAPEPTPTAEFEVSSLVVIPTEVVAGQAANVRAAVKNVGEIDGSYTANLTVDGKVVEARDINVSAGATEQVSFTYSTNITGTHSIELAGLTETFTVLRPPEFKISTMAVTPPEALAGDEVRIKADITNTGEVSGSYTATLTVEGDVSQTKEVTLEAGVTETVFFAYSPNAAGTYHLGLDGLTAALKVLEPAPPEPAEVKIINNRVVTDFPNTIAFIIEGSSAVPVASINLEYGTDKRSLVSEVSRVEPEYATDVKISTSYVWEMKKIGSIPPGARVWWLWRITDEDKRTYVTPRQTIVFEDTRYQWQVETAHDLDIYWYSLGASLVKELTEGVESRLARVKLEVDIPEERKPEVFVYRGYEELRSAVLFTQEWTGALAFWNYNIILIPVRPATLEWSKRTLAHEITHLLVREATFGPFGDIPTWLNEGLAQYAEGEMEEYHRQALDDAIKEDKLLSVRSLGSSFPADPDRASLAYAQSLSLVSFLIDAYDWAKIRELLATFKEGSTYDNALQEVYAFDTDGLEERWRAHVGAG